MPPRRPSPPASPAEISPSPQTPEATGAAEPDCLASLLAKGAVFKPAKIEAPPDPRCVVAQPVTVESLVAPGGRRIDLPDRPTVDCVAATTFASFIAEALAPLAKGSFDASIASIRTGPGFDCRTRDHVSGGKLSEHAKGLAIDIASIAFANGRVYLVGAMADDAERAFDHAARAAACGYFHTALGPGADAFHSSHWHVDLESRGADGKSKFCQ
ncbi:MAG: extensin family protein [Methylocella sp.]